MESPHPTGGPRELESWKEIAAYLGVSVRTAQAWEAERGLPVRRLGGRRGRVRITAAEIEAWKGRQNAECEKGSAPAPAASNAPEAVSPGTAWRPWVLVLCFGALASVAALLGARLMSREPDGYRIDTNSIIVLDVDGRELWRKSFSAPFPSSHAVPYLCWIGDLDGDGRREVLIRSNEGANAANPLICYGRDGTERWRFVPGRTVSTNSESFPPPYRVQAFAVAPLGKDGRLRVVVSAQHYLYYPNQVALLGPDGRLLREYWHSGGFSELLVHRGRVLLAGVHNASRTATLVALDPESMSGASVEENSSYQLVRFSPGREIGRLFFPRSCMNDKIGPFLTVLQFWREEGEFVLNIGHSFEFGGSVYYHLNEDLTLRAAVVSSSFEGAHAELRGRKVLDHDLTRAEAALLARITTDAGDAQYRPAPR